MNQTSLRYSYFQLTYGLERQFRGEIGGLEIFGRRLGVRGARRLDAIRSTVP